MRFLPSGEYTGSVLVVDLAWILHYEDTIKLYIIYPETECICQQ